MTKMRCRPSPRVIFVLAVLWLAGRPAFPCSTFLLKWGEAVLVGHNLDEYGHVPGVVAVNKRNTAKTSLSWAALLSGMPDGTPPLAWVSKYASITFNSLGREFPDGGMNEAGLFIGEMTLRETRYPSAPDKPRLFMCLWMQHLLDNYETVAQVVESAAAVDIDGWGWHFFAADKTGASAAVEFLNGALVVHAGQAMPVPVLGNSTYEEEMAGLKLYRGFGGEKPMALEDKEMPRFVQAAYMLKAYSPEIKPPVDYAFDVLRQMERGNRQWAYVCDLNNLEAFFMTAVSAGRKSVRLGDFDPGCTKPPLFLDIHAELKGDVSREFREYSPAAAREHVRRAWEAILKISPPFKALLAVNRTTAAELIERFAAYADETRCAK